MLSSHDSAVTEATGVNQAKRRVLAIAVVTFLGTAACGSASIHATSCSDQAAFCAPHNWAFRNAFPGVDALFNSFDYGHAKLYETLWRDPTAANEVLDRREFGFITSDLLRHPPRVPLDEEAIAPEWSKLAPEVGAMFDWAHMLHRQLYDVWTDDRIPPSAKDARVAAVLAYYRSRRSLAFSSLPKNMNLMEGQPYSLSFRKRYPKYNGL